MIRPVELTQSRRIVLASGDVCTGEDVWIILSASRDGDLGRVKQLVAGCPGLALCEYNYTPPVHFAVREGHADLVRFLLDSGADPTYRSYPFNDSLVTMARDRGHEEIAHILLDRIALRFPFVKDIARLLDAAYGGELETVRSELARDPSLAQASNETGDTALHRATEGGHLDLMLALLDSGAHVDAA
jgi:ankyrin repeat protein